MAITNCKSHDTVRSGEFMDSDAGSNCAPGACMISTASFSTTPFFGTPDFMAAWMQEDGNFVVYYVQNHTIGGQNTYPKWSSNTAQQGVKPYRLSLDHSGVLQIRDSRGAQLWKSISRNTLTQGPCRLIIQDDGNLVCYDAANVVMWASDTDGQTHP
jgi:hypothetical protein